MFWAAVSRLRRGETVRFRALGTSMVPVIRNLQRVAVVPANAELLDVGDVVVALVGGRPFLHHVSQWIGRVDEWRSPVPGAGSTDGSTTTRSSASAWRWVQRRCPGPGQDQARER